MGRRLRPLLVAVMTAALLLEPARSTTLRSHSTLQLSVPRTDLGAATAGGAAVFGGGCSKGSSGGGKTGGSCVSPSAAIDILRPARSTADGPAHPDDTWVLAESPAALSAARVSAPGPHTASNPLPTTRWHTLIPRDISEGVFARRAGPRRARSAPRATRWPSWAAVSPAARLCWTCST